MRGALRMQPHRPPAALGLLRGLLPTPPTRPPTARRALVRRCSSSAVEASKANLAKARAMEVGEGVTINQREAELNLGKR